MIKSIASNHKTLTAISHWEEDVYVAVCPEVELVREKR